jgi:hypothetical protein
MAASIFSLSPSSFTSLSAEAETRQEHLIELRDDLSEQGCIEGHKEDTFEQFTKVFRMVSQLSASNAEHFCKGYADGLQGIETLAMFLAGALDPQPSNV